MNSVFRMTKASLVLAFALAGIAAKVVWWLLGTVLQAGAVGYRDEVGDNEYASHTDDGRSIVD